MTVRQLIGELCTHNMDDPIVIRVGDSVCGISGLDWRYAGEPQILAKEDEEWFAKEIGWVEQESSL